VIEEGKGEVELDELAPPRKSIKRVAAMAFVSTRALLRLLLLT